MDEQPITTNYIAEKLKTVRELFTTSICDDCNNAQLGFSELSVNTKNAPSNISMGILCTFKCTNTSTMWPSQQQILFVNGNMYMRIYLGKWSEWIIK